MDTTEQQIFDALNKAKRVLIALPENPNGDAVGTGLALFGFIRKLEKEPEVVSSAHDLSVFQFLPNFQEIKKEPSVYQSFVISLSTDRAELSELSYETKPGRLDIFLKPKAGGKFSQSDVSFKSAQFPYDLIITVDAPSLDHLGEIYEKNTDLFFETPVVNLDHHPANEYYGQINCVDLTATSTAEILANLIEDFESGLIDEHIATNLLTGIIVETNSFQHVKTTPRAFLKASHLIAQGGRHQEIVKELYKTKSISLLKLWGRSLARLKEMPELGLTYSLVNKGDIEKTGSTSEDVMGVMKELISSLTDAKIILLLAEVSEQETAGYFHLHPSVKAQVVAPALGGQMLNGSLGTFRIKDKTLLETEKEVLEKLIRIKEKIVV